MVSQLDQLNKEIVSCYQCPRLVAWREEVARRQAQGVSGSGVLGQAGAGLWRPAGARAGGGTSLPVRTARIAPEGISPATLRGGSCIQPCIALGSRINPRLSREAMV